MQIHLHKFNKSFDDTAQCKPEWNTVPFFPHCIYYTVDYYQVKRQHTNWLQTRFSIQTHHTSQRMIDFDDKIKKQTKTFGFSFFATLNDIVGEEFHRHQI